MLTLNRISALSLASLLALAPAAFADDVISTKGKTALTQFGGRVEISHGGGSSEVVKKAPVLLNEGDRVSTAEGTAVVTFAEGSVIRLEAQSQAAVTSDSGSFMLIRLSAGKLWAKVSKIAGRKFEVRTENAVAAVRGTEFSMTVTGVMSSLVAVQEGRVSVRALSGDHPTGAERMLGAGESVGIVGKQASLDGSLHGQINAAPRAEQHIAANADVSRLGATPAAIRATFARETNSQLGQDAVQRAAAGASASPQAQESGATLQAAGARASGRREIGGKGADRDAGGGDATPIGIETVGRMTLGGDKTGLGAPPEGKTGDAVEASVEDSKTGLPTAPNYADVCPTCPKLNP
jgi:hypothetical protein